MGTSKEPTLEHMLQLAAAEPAHRPEFFRLLLDSNVYVLGSAGKGEGAIHLETGNAIHIQHWTKNDGTTAAPFFTSLETLQQSVDSAQPYLSLPARSLFEITLGTNLVLNPKSPYGKEFFRKKWNICYPLDWGSQQCHAPSRKKRKSSLGNLPAILPRWSIRYASFSPCTAT